MNECSYPNDYSISVIDKIDNPRLSNIMKCIGDLKDEEFVKSCLLESNPDLLFYLVSSFNVYKTSDYADALAKSVNIIHNVFNNIGNKTRVIWTGSSAQYGAVQIDHQPVNENTPFCPVSNYGALKVFEENEIRRISIKREFDFRTARIFNMTGPEEPERMVGGAFASQLLKSPKLNVGNLFPKRDFLDVRDVASALKTIGEFGKPDENYNVCSGSSISIESFLKHIADELGVTPEIKIDERRVNKNEIMDLVGNNSKLLDLGWRRKYNLKRSISDLINSIK